MDIASALSGISSLSIDERIELVAAIWETIIAEPGQPQLTDAQRQELVKRLEAHESSPEAVVSWEEVKAQALVRSRP